MTIGNDFSFFFKKYLYSTVCLTDMKIEKKVDKVQDKVEQIELRDIEEDYQEHVPALIWILKILITFGIITNLFYIVNNTIDVVVGSLTIIVFAVLLYALVFRRRWGWYYGLSVFIIQITLSILMWGSYGIITLLYWIVPMILFYLHKDYMDR